MHNSATAPHMKNDDVQQENSTKLFIITTVMYLWNMPRKRVLSHMHPNMLKIVTSATNAPAFMYLSLYSCARHPLVQH